MKKPYKLFYSTYGTAVIAAILITWVFIDLALEPAADHKIMRAFTFIVMLLDGLLLIGTLWVCPTHMERGAVGEHAYEAETGDYWVDIIYQDERFRFDGFVDAGIGPDNKPVLLKMKYYYAFNLRKPETKLATPHSTYKGALVE